MPFGSVPAVVMINGRAVTVSSGSLGPGPGPVLGPVPGPVVTSMTSMTSVQAGQPGRVMKPIQRPETSGVNGEEEDTLSKARKAAKVHLNALKEHVEEAGEDW